MSEVPYFRLNGFPWTDPLLIKDVPSKSIKQHTSVMNSIPTANLIFLRHLAIEC